MVVNFVFVVEVSLTGSPFVLSISLILCVLDGYSLTYMDSFIDDLLHKPRVCDIILPRLMSRYVLEQNDELEPRESALEDDLD